MTVGECIAQVDKLKPNKFSIADKVRWLSDIDGMICRELIDTHEDSPLTGEFTGYEEGVDDETVLIAPFPYDQLYRWYLESQIDLGNAEITKYNNSKTLYNTAYLTFTDWYNRTHLPKQTGGYVFTSGRARETGGDADALST